MSITYTNWDCTNCSTPNRNDEHYCGHCGTKKPRNPNYYLPTNPEVVTDADDLADSLIDVAICGNCDMHNKVTRDFCLECGHLMTHQLDGIHESTFVGVDESEVIAEDDLVIDTSKDERYDDRNMTYVHDEFESKLVENEVSEEKHTIFNSGKPILPPINLKINHKYVLITLAVLLFMFFVYWLSSDTKIQVQVNQFSWSSIRKVEQLKTFHENQWRKPVGAYDVSQKREIKNYRDSLTHYVTKYYMVNEVVGTEDYQENYTVKVSCGQTSYEDCHNEKVSCGTSTESYSCGRESCGTKINSNGYAETVYCRKTCTRQVTKYCSNRVCKTKYKTKYCNESRTRTKTRNVYGDVRHSKQVPKYKTVPVFAIKYYYTIDRWTGVTSKKGNDTGRIFKEVTDDSKGKIRMGRAINTFSVAFKDIKSKKLYHKNYNQSRWESFERNKTYIVLTNKLGKFEFQDQKTK